MKIHPDYDCLKVDVESVRLQDELEEAQGKLTTVRDLIRPIAHATHNARPNNEHNRTIGFEECSREGCRVFAEIDCLLRPKKIEAQL